ncbi:PIN2/TERF1-interacting telomerase inhibitor 1 [Aricia agestis]|uniref:PIN2/TERF1-interacting telomerase inhibitor 1 n=1 Tax=Aricia agestis TaxID=91739 RepID=UPI001C206DF2|nr:PIN2/TERF1-interacting telomerase inhibitor 1 [Aricia agestis]
MSMLAAPRRKQKVINLRAKNNEWSNDKNKFGQRMLEKMGWSEGKGLGANENGIVEHVIARYKNDEKGLGYVDRNDQWTKHEDDFNALLANLSNSSDQNLSQEVIHSGKSLESKSKKSKARIHYHKFTRGKDLARYSEKDLANIFGKKTLKPNENVEPANEENKEEKVFTEKGSMYDYFKNKMANISNSGSKLSKNNKDDEEIMDHCFQGFSNSNSSPQDSDEKESQSSNKHAVFSFYPQINVSVNQNDASSNGHLEESQNSKKKKKSKQKAITEAPSDQELPEGNDSNKKKKKKSKKRSQEEFVEQEEEQIVKKKKKKEKAPEEPVLEHADEPTEVTHKKKKKKNKKNDL